jgi:hypothetical protein
MANDSIRASRDWLANTRTSALAWWIPQVAIVGGLFVPVAVRAVIWIIALIWMGTACIVNARRCNRTHCRYTGPYYLAMIVLDSGVVTVDFYGWLALACVILLGRHCPQLESNGLKADVAFGPFMVESECGAVAVGRTYLFPPLSSGGALVVQP